jgi:N-acetylglucosamine transport system substrate-binding protein
MEECMVKKTAIFCAVLALVAAGVFAGGKQDASAATSSQVLKISAFEGGYGRAYWDDMAVQFQAAHPGVKVELTIDPEITTLLSTQTAAGVWPDFIYNIGDVPTDYVRNQEVLDITDIFEDDVPGHTGIKLKDYILPGFLETSICAPYGDGKIYFAPFNAGPMGLIYNKTLFDSKGWKVPNTWDEFFALGKELEKPENYVTINGRRVKRSLYAVQGMYPFYSECLIWPSIASAAGQAGINRILRWEKGSFNTPEVRSVFENIANIGSGKYLMEGTVALNHTESQADMMIGKALFIPCGVWIESEMADAPREEGFAFAMAPAPVMRSGQDHYVYSSYEITYIPKAAKNIAMAKEFLKSMYTDASIVSFARNASGVFAVKDAVNLGGSYLTPGNNSMYAVFGGGNRFMLMPFDPLPDNSRINPMDVVQNNLGALYTGAISVTEYINMIEEACAEITDDRARSR